MTKSTALIPILLAFGSFFEMGCTGAQLKEAGAQLMEGVSAKLKEELPKLKEAAVEEAKKIAEEGLKKAAAIAEAKMKEQEERHKTTLNEQLKHYATEDPETGMLTSKTWKDFDADKDDVLDEVEIAKISGYLMTQSAKKGELGTAGKGAGGALAALLAIALARRGVNKFAKKPAPVGSGPPAPAGATPTAPPGG